MNSDVVLGKWCRLRPDVYVAVNTQAEVGSAEIDFVAEEAVRNGHDKCRLLLHGGPEDDLHEMLIAHLRHYYVQPHANLQTKSWLVLRGTMCCVLFDDHGVTTDFIVLEAQAERSMLRLSEPHFHTILPLSDVVFIETALGPFRGHQYPDWAPRASGGTDFVNRLLHEFVETSKSRKTGG